MGYNNSPGGKATAVIFRKRAVDAYYQSPNYCKECAELIRINGNEKVQRARRRNFCNSSCAAKFNNKKKIRKKIESGWEPKTSWYKPKPRKEFVDWTTVFTKGQLKERCKNYQSFRSRIQRDARDKFKASKEYKCIVCGYSNHVEVSHIKAVSSFPDDVLVTVINDKDNLIGLCPTHHWEFDNGILRVNSVVEYRTHNPEVFGAIPKPAPIK